jgi:hypothetical protein
MAAEETQYHTIQQIDCLSTSGVSLLEDSWHYPSRCFDPSLFPIADSSLERLECVRGSSLVEETSISRILRPTQQETKRRSRSTWALLCQYSRYASPSGWSQPQLTSARLSSSLRLSLSSSTSSSHTWSCLFGSGIEAGTATICH